MKWFVLAIIVLLSFSCSGKVSIKYPSGTAAESGLNIFIVDSANFKWEVLKSKVPVVLYFWSPACGPCREMAPVFEELAKDFQGQPIKFAKCNIQENEDLFAGHGGSSVPAFYFWRQGKIVKKIIGSIPKEKLRKLIANHAKN